MAALRAEGGAPSRSFVGVREGNQSVLTISTLTRRKLENVQDSHTDECVRMRVCGLLCADRGRPRRAALPPLDLPPLDGWTETHSPQARSWTVLREDWTVLREDCRTRREAYYKER